MSILNLTIGTVVDLLQAPFEGLPPVLGILVWSIPTGVFALWVFKKSSNQQQIAAVKRKIHVCLFEIRLFNDDLRAIVRAQAEILRHVVHYQGLALIPMLFILPPLVLLMVQLHAFYGFRGLEPGEGALLTVSVADDSGAAKLAERPQIELVLPDGLSMETPGVWTPSLGQMAWRIGAETPGDYTIQIRAGDTTVTKSARVSDRVVRLSPTRPATSFIDQLEWPSEPPLPESSGLAEITLAYRDATVSLLGWKFEWRYAWMVVFFVFTMVIAVALKGPLGVEL
jgi:hypothetical protein